MAAADVGTVTAPPAATLSPRELGDSNGGAQNVRRSRYSLSTLTPCAIMSASVAASRLQKVSITVLPLPSGSSTTRQRLEEDTSGSHAFTEQAAAAATAAAAA